MILHRGQDQKRPRLAEALEAQDAEPERKVYALRAGWDGQPGVVDYERVRIPSRARVPASYAVRCRCVS